MLITAAKSLLERDDICPEGVVFFQMLADAQGLQGEEGTVTLDWTPLHDLLLMSRWPQVSYWLRAKGIIPKLNLSGANLRYVSVPGACLRRVDLSGASLEGANLAGVDFRQANLTGADLTGADLTGAVLEGTALHGAVRPEDDIPGWTAVDGILIEEEP